MKSVMKLSIVLVTLGALFSLQLKASVPHQASEVQPIEVGQSLPQISFNNAAGESISLNQLAKGKKTILVYYRGGWCPFCNKQLQGLAESREQLKRLGFQIIAVSADSPEQLKQSSSTEKLGYQLFSDAKMLGARKLGIAFRVDDMTYQLYRDHFQLDLEEKSGEVHHELPVPAVFLIDEAGSIQYRYFNPDYKKRLTRKGLMEAIAEGFGE